MPTVEYQLQSDFAAWPNALTLLNNLAAAMLPTYMLRGLDTAGAASQLTAALESLVGSVTGPGCREHQCVPDGSGHYPTLAGAGLPDR